MSSIYIDDDFILHFPTGETENKNENEARNSIRLSEDEKFGLWLSRKMMDICRYKELSDIIQFRIENFFAPESHKDENEKGYCPFLIRIHTIKGHLDDIFLDFRRNKDEDLPTIAKQKAKEIKDDVEFVEWMKTVLVRNSMDITSIAKHTKKILFGSPFVFDNTNDDSDIEYTSYWKGSPTTIAKSIYYVRANRPNTKWDSYKSWRDSKRLNLCHDSFYCYQKNTWLKTYPLFYVYDLLCNGDLCSILFDILNEPSIKTSHKVQIFSILTERQDASDIEYLRRIDTLYEPYRLLGGSVLHFWPWNYSDIKLDFTAFYKEVTKYQKGDTIPHGFLDNCLPTIVEEVLPSIKNAVQAVALVTLIWNAKNFNVEWKERLSTESFKERMIGILRLDEYERNCRNLRFSNKRVREVASLLYDKFHILKKYTFVIEGD